VLLDTVVVSALRKPRQHASVVAWLADRRPDDVFLSVVTIAELHKGQRKKSRDDPPQGLAIARWIDAILRDYEDRILPVDAAVARRWGQLSDELGHDGPDLILAATALEHDLVVATRNVRHFEPAGVVVINPFDLPAEP
jgi:toxin FitB